MGAVAHPPLPREDTAELLHEPFKGVARDLSNDQLHPCHSRATGLHKSRQSSANYTALAGWRQYVADCNRLARPALRAALELALPSERTHRLPPPGRPR